MVRVTEFASFEVEVRQHGIGSSLFLACQKCSPESGGGPVTEKPWKQFAPRSQPSPVTEPTMMDILMPLVHPVHTRSP
jgi:hypothetical protein